MLLLSFWFLDLELTGVLRRILFIFFVVFAIGCPGTPLYFGLSEIAEKSLQFGKGFVYLFALCLFLNFSVYASVFRRITTGLNMENRVLPQNDEMQEQYLVLPFLLIIFSVVSGLLLVGSN